MEFGERQEESMDKPIQRGRLWAIKCDDGKLRESQKRPRLYISEKAARDFARTLDYTGSQCSPAKVIEVTIKEVKRGK